MGTTTRISGLRSRRRRFGPKLGLFLLFVLSAGAVFFWWSMQPNKQHVVPDYMAAPHPIMVEGKWTGTYAIGEGDGLLIPMPLAKKLMGDGIRYEAGTESIILTTDTSVLHFNTGKLQATLNSKPFDLRFGTRKAADGTLYLPFAPLRQLFGLTADIASDTGIVSLYTPGQSVKRGTSSTRTSDQDATVKLRSGPGSSYPIVEDLKNGTVISLWEETDGWYRAESIKGHLGYLRGKDVTVGAVVTIPSGAADENKEPFVPWKLTGKRINLTWDAIYQVQPDPTRFGEMPGVNVISPTWFELLDGTGQIRSKADAGYSAWARNKGLQVWGVFSNSFEPKRTHDALASYETRSRMIGQVLAYAQTFRLQGINLDFENVYTKDKDNFVQFVRELTPILHDKGIVVSVDITPKSNSEMWSVFLDRARLAQAADYLILMAYDEHWGSSPVSGSVSSLPWTEDSITRILEEDGVAPGQLILAMPYYTRQWKEVTDKQGAVKVTSKTLGMNAVSQLLKDKKITPVLSEETGQHYAEFIQDGAKQRIWLEDEWSIQSRAALVTKYKLAGAATWTRTFASDAIWGVLDKALQTGS